jgi:hypothetical protein
MDSEALTPLQAAVINKALFHHLNYLCRLMARMERRGFPLSNPLYQKVAAAYDAAHRLFIELHYLSCTSGIGLSPGKPE